MAKKQFEVERTRTIAAPAEQIWPHVVDFRKWVAWSPWEGLDPDLKRTYGGPEAGVGSTYAWAGNSKAGEGSMEILEASEPSSLLIRLLFTKPWKADNRTHITLTPEGGGTRVSWRMTGEQGPLAAVFSKLFNMDKRLGGDFERGLRQLDDAVTKG